MKNIHDPEYSHIKKLLQSSIREDVIIGLEIVSKDFNEEELLSSFPNHGSDPLTFKTKIEEVMWKRVNNIVIGTGESIYAFEAGIDDPYVRHFRNEEIK